MGSHANLGGVVGRVISDSRTALKRVQVSPVFRLSKAITKHSKYGLTVLVLPSCLFLMLATWAPRSIHLMILFSLL